MKTRFALYHPKARAFTLIELLTVIAIIGILAAIIIPTVTKVRATAKKAQCMSVLRQWGTAVRLFSNDHKGLIALNNGIGTGQRIYSDYFGAKTMLNANGKAAPSQEVMSRCPSDEITDTTDAEYRARSYELGRPTLGTLGGIVSIPYATLGTGFSSDIPGYRISDAAVSSRLLLMVETHSKGGNNAYTVNDPAASWNDEVKLMQSNTDSRLVRHEGKVNILFLDGHVASFSLADTDYNNPANKPIMNRWFTLR